MVRLGAIAIFAACAAVTGFGDSPPTATPQEAELSPPGASLSRDEATWIAIAAAVMAGYNRSDYLQTHVYYEAETHKWTVFFEGKNPTPGNHFLVVVDDRNKTSRVMPGE